MIESPLAALLLLLVAAVFALAAAQRLHVPSILAYLLVGLLLGPHTPGPVIDIQAVRLVADFGIVFLLFTIGLAFTLPQIHALRHFVLGLGTGQVVLSALVVGVAAWAAGLPPAPAFVVGAAFAQSSTMIISRQLAEQGEEESRHGRIGLSVSVFQDVTAVPFVILIPVLAVAQLGGVAGTLGAAVVKAVAAFAIIYVAGRWLMQPLFHAIAARRSAELFTLTVLMVSLLSAWVTERLGLSPAFGAFLAGTMLGDTPFRPQIEAAIRPFRDVLLGLFFVGIGMLIDPAAMARTLHWAAAAAVVLLAAKILVVAGLARAQRVDWLTALRIGIVLAVGGEFGFALIAIGAQHGVLEAAQAQTALAAILLSMVLGPLLIRHGHAIALSLTRAGIEVPQQHDDLRAGGKSGPRTDVRVIICGYGRIGQSVAHFLEEEDIAYVALDLDPRRVREARAAGEPVYYGDAAQREVLEALGVARAQLVLVSHEDVESARMTIHHVRSLRPDLPIMVRTRDESHVDALRRAGATEVVPETLEGGLMIASYTLLLLDVPLRRVLRRMDRERATRYQLLRESFRGEEGASDDAIVAEARMHPVVVPAGSRAIGRTLDEVVPAAVRVAALVRGGVRRRAPARSTRLAEGDTVVLHGLGEDIAPVERALLD